VLQECYRGVTADTTSFSFNMWSPRAREMANTPLTRLLRPIQPPASVIRLASSGSEAYCGGVVVML
jgi:hypothetical protein